MSDALRIYFGISETHNSEPEAVDIAPIHDPIKEIAITGDSRKYIEYTIAAGATKELWNYLEFDKFEALAVVIQDQDGYLDLAWQVDRPTSDTNTAPLGTCRRINQAGVSCFAPWVFSSDNCLVNPTLATAAGLDGSSLPAIFSDGGTVAGRLYKLWAKNPGTTAVKVKVYIRN